MTTTTTPALAVRTVSETDDVRVIEGLAYPFKGKDTYGTFFSARTDFHWDLFPDTDPAVRSDAEPAFIRPATFHHGFDPDFGLSRVGGWSPVRTDADGVWVQAQIDKREKHYATRLGPLLDAGALGLSGGSAEHSVRIDQKNGEILDWPAYELALTPVESNPLAQIATRAAETAATITVRDSGEPEPEATPEPTPEPSPEPAPDPVAIKLDQILQLLTTTRSSEPADFEPVSVTVPNDAPDFEAIRADFLAKAEQTGKAVASRVTG